MNKSCHRAYLSIWGASQKIWGDLAQFWPYVGVCCTQNPVRHAHYMRRTCWKFELRGGSVCAAPLCLCTAPWNLPPTLLQTRMMHTQTLCNVSLCLDLHNDFDFGGNLYIKTWNSWFKFFLSPKTHFSNVMFWHFFIDLKQHWFSLSLWNFSSNDESFGTLWRDCMTGHLATETMSTSKEIN